MRDGLLRWLVVGAFAIISGRCALSSTSNWDQYLRQVTPDLPTYLSDWASNNLQTPDRFRRFWAELFWVTSNREREVLRVWYEGEAKSVADPAFVLEAPEWMRED